MNAKKRKNLKRKGIGDGIGEPVALGRKGGPEGVHATPSKWIVFKTKELRENNSVTC